MSYKESEFPDLIEGISRIAEKYGDASLTLKVLNKVVELHKQIPLYPGIVGMCLERYLQETDVSGIRPGDKVVCDDGARRVVGTVKSSGNGKILLKDVSVVKKDDELEINGESIVRVLKFKEDILKEIWPTLVFKEDTAGAASK
ncbi:MAG: hypothetical protein ABIH68_02820 [bacterium]